MQDLDQTLDTRAQPAEETKTLSIQVTLPTALARHTEGQKTFNSDAENLPGLLADVDTRYPALAGNIKDDTGKLRKFINVYVNDEDIRFLGGDAHQFEDGDEIMLIPSIAGGHCGQRRWLTLPYGPELL